MNPKILGVLVVGVFLGSILGYCGSYFLYTPQISVLSDNYDATVETLKGLSSDVLNFEELLRSYCYLEESFPRVLCSSEVEEVSSIVSSITRSADMWSSFENLYEYLVDHIEYVHDIEFPYITTYQYVSLDGKEVVTSFSTDMLRNYIQTPQFTLETEQGDCDDQAVLAYAMIKYYEKYVHGTEYDLYIASMEFASGSSHVSVFIPVANGGLCVFDPAGKYLTKSRDSIASNAALSEFQHYDDSRSSDGEITKIELYNINAVTGIPTMVESGSINKIAKFLDTQ